MVRSIGLRRRIQRIVNQVRRQHHALAEAQAELEQALREGRVDAIMRACERYCEALRAHFDLEEQVFFPAVHGLLPDRERTILGLDRDHLRFREEAEALGGRVERGDWSGCQAALRILRSALDEHEATEEELVRSAIEQQDQRDRGSSRV
jgi:hypothetical protein